MKSDSPSSDQLIKEYLTRLERALRDLPRDRRTAIVEDIREHIRTARERMEHEDEAQIHQLLDDLGSPSEIRAEADLPPLAEVAWGDVAAPWLLLFGGFVFVVGWVAGVVLLWNSSVWKLADKILATLVWPLGLAGLMVAYGLPVGVSGSQCSSSVGGAAPLRCTGTPTPGHILPVLAIVVGIGAPVFVNVRLMQIQRRASRPY